VFCQKISGSELTKNQWLPMS